MESITVLFIKVLYRVSLKMPKVHFRHFFEQLYFYAKP